MTKKEFKAELEKMSHEELVKVAMTYRAAMKSQSKILKELVECQNQGSGSRSNY